jgi:hypothetical protein
MLDRDPAVSTWWRVPESVASMLADRLAPVGRFAENALAERYVVSAASTARARQVALLQAVPAGLRLGARHALDGRPRALSPASGISSSSGSVSGLSRNSIKSESARRSAPAARACADCATQDKCLRSAWLITGPREV